MALRSLVQLSQRFDHKSASDSKCLQIVAMGFYHDDPEVLYKSLVAKALSGADISERSLLPPEMQLLILARAKMFAGDFAVAQEMMENLKETKLQTGLLKGDRAGILGNLHFLKKEWDLAVASYDSAAKYFTEAGETFRFLRILLNGKLAKEPVSSFLGGEIYSLEQAYQQLGHLDLVAGIQKARSCELIRASRFQEARQQAMLALANFDRDGLSEDRAVALCLIAICLLIERKPAETKIYSDQISFEGGKLKAYTAVMQTLMKGKRVVLSENHPLFGAQFKTACMNSDLIEQLGKAFASGPKSKKELIAALWPGELPSVSHVKRLHTLIYRVKKSKLLNIRFEKNIYHCG